MRETADLTSRRGGPIGQLEGKPPARAEASGQTGDKQLERCKTAAGQAEAEVMESTSDPEFILAVEVTYHGMRQHFLSTAHRWMMFATIVFGASAAIPFWGDKGSALFAAATAAADLAFDFTGRAQVHADIKRRYFEMVAEQSRGELQDFEPRWMAVSADEPPLFKYVSVLAERDACLNLEREIPERLKIGLFRRLTAHLFRG